MYILSTFQIVEDPLRRERRRMTRMILINVSVAGHDRLLKMYHVYQPGSSYFLDQKEKDSEQLPQMRGRIQMGLNNSGPLGVDQSLSVSVISAAISPSVVPTPILKARLLMQRSKYPISSDMSRKASRPSTHPSGR